MVSESNFPSLRSPGIQNRVAYAAQTTDEQIKRQAVSRPTTFVLGELDFLNAEACEIGQGYYLGKPSPIEAFVEFTGTTASPAREEAAVQGNGGVRPRRAAPRLRSV